MYLEAAIIIFGGLGLMLLLAGLRRLWKRRFITGSLQGISGALLIAIAAVFFALLGNFYIYHRLTAEQPLAELHFTLLGQQHYQATVRYPSGGEQQFDIHGDEWQLDARIIKWEGYATLVGFDTAYRLDRFSGRYRDLTQERADVRSVYDVSQPPQFDMWVMAKDYNKWIPWVDAIYGSAAYLPMADNADFAVSLTTSGLAARPLNEPARTAIEQWH